MNLGPLEEKCELLVPTSAISPTDGVTLSFWPQEPLSEFLSAGASLWAGEGV